MGFSRLSATLAAGLVLLGQATAIEPLIMKGTKFFYKNGTQFFIKGVAYQQDTGAAGTTTGVTFTDPLKDATLCARDVPLLAALGTNMIRTYAIDPRADHSECMAMLSNAGIYVISDLSEPQLSIQRDTPTWTTELFTRYRDVVTEMAKYDNTMGFFAGNEVTNNKSNTPASAYVKAAVRDTKKFIATQYPGRWMGVGYAANDDADIRENIAHYFNCGKQEDAIDYWGYNIYEWCGESTFEKSGYATQVEFFKNFSVPVFFAEYGCNQGGAANRIWQETTALYSKQMTDVFSGGIVYMYFQETNDYGESSPPLFLHATPHPADWRLGLVTVSGGKASTMRDYGALQTVIAEVNPSSTAMGSYTPTNSPQACPAVNDNWLAHPNLPPTPDEQTCQCMFNSLRCVPSSRLAVKAYGELFGSVCGTASKPCAGITGNTQNGVFGAYSMCNATQQLGYALDQYYQSQKSAAGACDWQGQAVLLPAAAAAAGDCGARLSSASASNVFAATATAPAGSPNMAGPMSIRNAFTIGDFAIGLYVCVAMIAGAGFIIL